MPSPSRNRPSEQQVEVVGGVRQVHRAARERDGDVGHEVERAYRRGGDQGEEEVVGVLEAEHAVDAGRSSARARSAAPTMESESITSIR